MYILFYCQERLRSKSDLVGEIYLNPSHQERVLTSTRESKGKSQKRGFSKILENESEKKISAAPTRLLDCTHAVEHAVMATRSSARDDTISNFTLSLLG